MRERDEMHYGAEVEGDPEGAGSEGHISQHVVMQALAYHQLL